MYIFLFELRSNLCDGRTSRVGVQAWHAVQHSAAMSTSPRVRNISAPRTDHIILMEHSTKHISHSREAGLRSKSGRVRSDNLLMRSGPECGSAPLLQHVVALLSPQFHVFGRTASEKKKFKK